MSTTSTLREPEARHRRLDEDRVHVLALDEYAAELRQEREYLEHGRTGVILAKTRDLRVVLEVVAPGRGLAEHVIHGPATVLILEGELEFQTRDRSFVAGRGRMVVLPHDEPRSVQARAPSVFLLTLAPQPESAG